MCSVQHEKEEWHVKHEKLPWWKGYFLNSTFASIIFTVIVGLLAIFAAWRVASKQNILISKQNEIVEGQNDLIAKQNEIITQQKELQEKTYKSENYPSVAVYEQDEKIHLRNVGDKPFYYLPSVIINQKGVSVDGNRNTFSGIKSTVSINKSVPVFPGNSIVLTQPIKIWTGQFEYEALFDIKNYQGFQYHVIYNLSIEWKDGKVLGAFPNLVDITEIGK